jgi:GntR family transcriptional regulator
VRERPAYIFVAEELRQRIRTGTYAPGARLPTIEELRRVYGVSEIVIRHAVALLRHEGLVETRRGGGTIVRSRPQVRRRAMERYAADSPDPPEPRTSFTADHAIGWTEYQLTTDYSHVSADEELATLFGAEPGLALLRRHFVFYARGEPEQISVNYLPLDLVDGTPVADPAREPWPGGTVAQLASLGFPVSRIEESVSARMPDGSETRTLRVAPGVPVFVILRRMISGDAVLEVCRHIVIPADRVVLEYGIDLAAPHGAHDLAESCCRQPETAIACERFVMRNQLDVRVYSTVTSHALPPGVPAHRTFAARRQSTVNGVGTRARCAAAP